MKKTALILLAVMMTLALSACAGGNEQEQAENIGSLQDAEHETLMSDNDQPVPAAEGNGQPFGETAEMPSTGAEPEGSKILVAYFSATNNTEDVAQKLAEGLGADIYEIVPEVPYTDADLNYGDSTSRTSAEMNDPDARPGISGQVENMEQYSIIYLGYPIWWGEAPRIMSTFMESYDFDGKTIIPFCTSGSSPFGSSDAALRMAAESAVWMDGRRFSAGASADEIMEWADGFERDTANAGEEENAMMQMKIGETVVSVEWESNESVEALKALCEDQPLEIQMSMYGGFEQVGSIGQSLPRNDVQTTTQSGDIVLYSGNQIVVFYGSNSWSYTRLGRITGQTADDMERLLGNGDVTITIS